MLSMKAIACPQATALPHFEERVTGASALAGETSTARFICICPRRSPRRVAAAMLGLAPEDLGRCNEVNDVVGEASNMLTGGLKSWLCDSGAECAVSTPAIIRGSGFCH